MRVVIVHNVDYEDDGDPGRAARADVQRSAQAAAAALEAPIVEADGDLVMLRDRLRELAPDCVLNLCESLAGDARLESAVPLLLESMGIPFTGSPAETLSLALYKDRAKARLESAGVPTPRGVVLRRTDDPWNLPFPLIVKPVREDGSVGITPKSVVTGGPSLRAAATEILVRHRQPCLVEEYIPGRELNVALLGHPEARVLPLSEIEFSVEPPIVSYDAKWTSGSPEDRGTRPVQNPSLIPAVEARVREVAKRAFAVMGLRDYGRIDIRLSEDGAPWVIDVNPNCDLSPGAGMARAAEAAGLDYPALLRRIVGYARDRSPRA